MRKGVRDIIFALSMLGLGALLWWETTGAQYEAGAVQDYGFDPAFFPRILLVLWIVLSLVILVRSWLVWSERIESQKWLRLAGCMLLCVVYVALMHAVGFLFASIAFAFAAMSFLGLQRPVWIALVGVLFPLLTWYCFVHLLQLPLPHSPWFTRV